MSEVLAVFAALQDERRTELRKRSLLVLIQHHLLECGYVAAAVALDQETGGSLRRFQACDNVDLEVVLCEYESYHYCKHSKYPKFIRKAVEGPGECGAEPPTNPQTLLGSVWIQLMGLQCFFFVCLLHLWSSR